MELQYVYLGLRYSSWMLNTGYTLGAFASVCLITMTRPSSKSNANEPFGHLDLTNTVACSLAVYNEHNTTSSLAGRTFSAFLEPNHDPSHRLPGAENPGADADRRRRRTTETAPINCYLVFDYLSCTTSSLSPTLLPNAFAGVVARYRATTRRILES